MNKDKQRLYASPQAEVEELQALAILCQSNTERMTEITPGWSFVDES